MATIKDIAKIAGVSIGTVSNFINGSKPVNFETAEKIRKAIKKTSYEPNYLAKNLRMKTHNDIGVLLPNFDNPYFVKIFEGIESVIRETDYAINLALSYNREDYEKKCIENLLRKQISGLILVTSMPWNWEFYYNSFTKHNKPLVLLDRNINSLEASFISFNYRDAFSQLTTALIQKGKKNIFLFVESTEFDCETECIKGFQLSHETNRLKTDESHIVSGIESKEDGFRAVLEIFKEQKPDAIMTTSEDKSNGIIEGLLFLGYSTEDIPVITLGEDHWNEKTYSSATISTKRPAVEMGVKAAESLLELIRYPISDTNNIILGDRILDEHFETKLLNNKTNKISTVKKKIKLLMLETPQTHALISMLRNFTINTGIEIEYDIVEHQNLFNEIINDQNDKKGEYDVFMFDAPWLRTLVQRDLIQDISNFVKEADFYDSIFYPGTADYFGQVNNNVYGLPFMHAVQILYYRKDLFDNPEIKASYSKKYRSPLRPPKTWKEFNTIARFFSKDTDVIKYGTSIPGAYPECLSPEIFLRFFSHGNNIFDKHKKVNFDNSKTLKVYTQLMQTVRFSKPNWEKTNDEDVVKDFLRGETALLVSYPSFMNEIALKINKGIKNEKIGFALTPKQSPILGGWGLGISPLSSSQESSFKFLEWACTDLISNYFSILGGFTAVKKTYKNDELMRIYPWFSSYYSANKTAKPLIPPVDKNNKGLPQSKIDEIICHWFYEMAKTKISIPVAIKNTQKELEELLTE